MMRVATMMMVPRLVVLSLFLLARSATNAASLLRSPSDLGDSRKLEQLDELPEGVTLSTILGYGKQLTPKIEKTLQSELADPTAFSVLETPTIPHEIEIDVSDLCGGDEVLNVQADVTIKAIHGMGSLQISDPTALSKTGFRSISDTLSEWVGEFTFETESFDEDLKVVADVVFSGSGCGGLITIMDNVIPDVPITFVSPKMDFVVAILGVVNSEGESSIKQFSITSMHFEADDHVVTGGIYLSYTNTANGKMELLPISDLGDSLEDVFSAGMDAYVEGNLPVTVDLKAPPRDTFGIGFNQTMVDGQPVECTPAQARFVNRIIKRVAKLGNFLTDATSFEFMQALDDEIDLAEKECLAETASGGGTDGAANDRLLRKVSLNKKRFKKIAKKLAQKAKKQAKRREQRLDNGASVVCEEDEEEEEGEERERGLQLFVEQVLEEKPKDQGERKLWGDPCSSPEYFWWYDCGCGGSCERRRRRRLTAIDNMFRQLSDEEEEEGGDDDEHNFTLMQTTARELCAKFQTSVPCMDCSTVTVWQIKDR